MVVIIININFNILAYVSALLLKPNLCLCFCHSDLVVLFLQIWPFFFFSKLFSCSFAFSCNLKITLAVEMARG